MSLNDVDFSDLSGCAGRDDKLITSNHKNKTPKYRPALGLKPSSVSETLAAVKMPQTTSKTGRGTV